LICAGGFQLVQFNLLSHLFVLIAVVAVSWSLSNWPRKCTVIYCCLPTSLCEPWWESASCQVCRWLCCSCICGCYLHIIHILCIAEVGKGVKMILISVCFIRSLFRLRVIYLLLGEWNVFIVCCSQWRD